MKIWNIPNIEFVPFDELEEDRPVIVVTTAGAWEAVAEDLQHLTVADRVQVSEATILHWLNLTTKLQSQITSLQSPIIYAVGGGLAVGSSHSGVGADSCGDHGQCGALSAGSHESFGGPFSGGDDGHGDHWSHDSPVCGVGVPDAGGYQKNSGLLHH